MPRVTDVSYSQYAVWKEHVDLTHDMSCVIFQLEALWDVCVFDLSSGFAGTRSELTSEVCGEHHPRVPDTAGPLPRPALLTTRSALRIPLGCKS